MSKGDGIKENVGSDLGKQIENKIEVVERIKRQANELKTFKNPNIYEITAFQLEQQADYYELTLQQSQQGIYLARNITVLGLVITAISLAFFSVQIFGIVTNKNSDAVIINIGIAILICGVLFEAFAFVMFYYSYSRRFNGLDSLQEHLDISHRLLTANKICEEISTGDAKKEAQLILIKSLLEIESDNRETLKSSEKNNEKEPKEEITENKK